MHPHRVAVVIGMIASMAGAPSALADQRKPIDEKKVWDQRWSKAADYEKSWVRSTRACETQGMTDAQAARANTGNGYLGALQYDQPTWWAAPNTGGKRGDAHQLPHLEPLLVQYVVSIKKMRRDGTSPWPNCG